MNQVEAGILENKILGELAPVVAQFWASWIMHDSIKGIFKCSWATSKTNDFYYKKCNEWYDYHNSKDEKNIKIKKSHELTLWADMVSTALIENYKKSKNIVEQEENEINILGFKIWTWWIGIRDGVTPKSDGANRTIFKYLLTPLKTEYFKDDYTKILQKPVLKELQKTLLNSNYSLSQVDERCVYLIFKTIEEIFIYCENQIDEDINDR